MKRPPAIPRKAKAEIAEAIARDGHISANDLDGILKKHRVKGDVQTLQRGYRLRTAQRYLSSFRDEEDRRRVLSFRDPDTKESEYIHIDLCNDESLLKSIQNRLHNVSASTQVSSDKVGGRIQTLRWLRRPFEILRRRP